MDKITGFVVWICKKFNREQITRIIEELKQVLLDPNAEIKPKDTFKEEHPEYRHFKVDPEPPLREPEKKKSEKASKRF